MLRTWSLFLRNLRKQQKEGQPKKVPNWHLTSEESMKYIKTAHDKKLTERKKQEKYDKAKKDAVAKVKAEEQRLIKVVTCLFKPAPRLPKAVKWVSRR